MHSNSFRHRLIHGAVAVLLAASLLPATAFAQTLITTADGNVQGQSNELTREFLGIPYAAPPVGALRFAPPRGGCGLGFDSRCNQLPAGLRSASDADQQQRSN